MKKIPKLTKIGFSITWVVFILSLVSFLIPVEAKGPTCKFNPNHGWHVVGGKHQDDNKGPWFPTQQACLDSIHGVKPTKTPKPTQIIVTKTPKIVTATPAGNPTSTPSGGVIDPRTLPTMTPVGGPRGIACDTAWKYIQNNIFKDEGYRFFDNPEHAWCRVWLMNHYGIDYYIYKAQNPGK